jgi:flagellar basal-body rod protein FlgB
MKILDGVERLRGSLDYTLARQNLLASNLAQMNTPGYKPKDLVRADFDKALRAEMVATDPRHLHGENGASAVGRVVEDPSVGAGGDGNSVSLDREAVKVATNNVRYDALASLVAGELQGLEWAVNDGKIG